MKKVIFILILLMISCLTLPAKVNVYENIKLVENKTISIDKIYSCWDDAKEAGEYIYDNQIGKLKFSHAYRIGATEEFRVTYIKVNDQYE